MAVALTGVIYLVMMARVRAGTDPAAQTMGASMGPDGIRAYTISQAFGFAALVWSWGTIMLGLVLSMRVWAGRSGARSRLERLHRSTSLTVIALILAHAVLLLWDNMASATPLQLFVPFASSYAAKRLPLALGILAFYGALAFGPTFYLRDRLGPRTWRMIHAVFIPLVYILGVWHTFVRGEDLTADGPLWLVLWAMQVPVIVAFAARILAPARRSGRRAHWTRTLARHRSIDAIAAGQPDGALSGSTQRKLAVVFGLVIAAVVGIGLFAGGMPGAGMPSTGSANPWLPGWLRIAGAGAYLGIGVVHLWHLRVCRVDKRLWHTGHILMALGMIDMFAPAGHMPVPATAGTAVFTAAVGMLVAYLVVATARGQATAAVWPLAGLDLAAMVYMFTLPAPGFAWLTGLLVGWFVLQATGWALGTLPVFAGSEPTPPHQDTPAPAAASGPSGATTVATLAAPAITTRRAIGRSTGHDLSVRITLAVMSLGMAYMFLAMQLGMAGMSGHAPGMGGMPGM